MVAWYWYLLVAVIAAWFGAILAALMTAAKDADACARALWRATSADISSAEVEALRQERDYLRACLQELRGEGSQRTEGQASSQQKQEMVD